MKSKQRRSTHCSNCDSPLEENYNFCPICGQSNTDNNITFSILLREFVDNYLGVDSKMANSIRPFLFRPGKLTNRFQEGKIKHFIHPVRLYLVLSVFYFFVVSTLLNVPLAELDNSGIKIPATAELEDLRNDPTIHDLSDSIKMSLVNDSLKAKFSNITSFDPLYDSLVKYYNADFIAGIDVEFDAATLLQNNREGFFNRTSRLARDQRISDDAFLDSLNNGTMEIDFWSENSNTHAKSQIRKIFKNEEGFKGFVLGNLPLMMFLLIPLFAGVLKLIYVRRKHLYIKHIVHALHVHSFAYLIYGLGLLLMFKVFTEANFPNLNIDGLRVTIGSIIFVGVSTYVYISFLNVYKQGWFKTLVKFNLVGFIYVFFLWTFFSLEFFISFWYY